MATQLRPSSHKLADAFSTYLVNTGPSLHEKVIFVPLINYQSSSLYLNPFTDGKILKIINCLEEVVAGQDAWHIWKTG